MRHSVRKCILRAVHLCNVEVDEEDERDHGSELPDDKSEDCRSSEETDYEDMPELILKSKQGLQYVSGYIAK